MYGMPNSMPARHDHFPIRTKRSPRLVVAVSVLLLNVFE